MGIDFITHCSLADVFRNTGFVPSITVWSSYHDGTTVLVRWEEEGEVIEERYGSLSTALARLALLAYRGEGDESLEFVTDDLQFVEDFDDYASTQVV